MGALCQGLKTVGYISRLRQGLQTHLPEQNAAEPQPCGTFESWATQGISPHNDPVVAAARLWRHTGQSMNWPFLLLMS